MNIFDNILERLEHLQNSINRVRADNRLKSVSETAYQLHSPANAEHLNRSIAQYNAGKTKQRDLIDDE